MVALGRARGLIKRDIGDWLQLRTVPEIVLKQDHSIERGMRVLEIMNSLEQDGRRE
jgi:ribosome-binding factor A